MKMKMKGNGLNDRVGSEGELGISELRNRHRHISIDESLPTTLLGWAPRSSANRTGRT